MVHDLQARPPPIPKDITVAERIEAVKKWVLVAYQADMLNQQLHYLANAKSYRYQCAKFQWLWGVCKETCRANVLKVITFKLAKPEFSLKQYLSEDDVAQLTKELAPQVLEIISSSELIYTPDNLDTVYEETEAEYKLKLEKLKELKQPFVDERGGLEEELEAAEARLEQHFRDNSPNSEKHYTVIVNSAIPLAQRVLELRKQLEPKRHDGEMVHTSNSSSVDTSHRDDLIEAAQAKVKTEPSGLQFAKERLFDFINWICRTLCIPFEILPNGKQKAHTGKKAVPHRVPTINIGSRKFTIKTTTSKQQRHSWPRAAPAKPKQRARPEMPQVRAEPVLQATPLPKAVKG